MLKNQQIVVLARKRKSKIWRVRSTPPTGHKYTPEKARLGVCGAIPNRAQVHARKEKARLDVCGAITDAFPQITR